MSNIRRVVLLATLAILVVFTAALASDRKNETIPLLEKLGLTVVSEVPTGVIPLHVNSVKEVEALIRGFKLHGRSFWDDYEPSLLDGESSTRTSIDARSVHYSYICNPIWRTRFNLWATVYVAASGSFHWIDDVRGMHVGLSGFQPFMNLEDTYTDSYIYPNQQRVRLEGGGTLEYYLLIEGILTYYSEPVWIIAYYSI